MQSDSMPPTKPPHRNPVCSCSMKSLPAAFLGTSRQALCPTNHWESVCSDLVYSFSNILFHNCVLSPSWSFELDLLLGPGPRTCAAALPSLQLPSQSHLSPAATLIPGPWPKAWVPTQSGNLSWYSPYREQGQRDPGQSVI